MGAIEYADHKASESEIDCGHEECKKQGCRGPRLRTVRVGLYDMDGGNLTRQGKTVLICMNERRSENE